MAKRPPARKSRSSRVDVEIPPESSVVHRLAGEKVKRQKTVRFDYLKSHLYRVIIAEGFHGGLTPSGKVHMSLFNERRPIARSETYRLSPDGTLGDMMSRVERDSVVREVEVSVVMDLEKAASLRLWLDRVFKQVEEIQKRGKARKRV